MPTQNCGSTNTNFKNERIGFEPIILIIITETHKISFRNTYYTPYGKINFNIFLFVPAQAKFEFFEH